LPSFLFKSSGAGLPAASQAEQEAATAVDRTVTPGRQQLHPSAAKAWVSFQGTGTVTVLASYNVSSVSDNGAGDYTVNFTTAFSSESYGYAGTAEHDAGTAFLIFNVFGDAPPTASAFRLTTLNVAGIAADGRYNGCAFFGDQ
jgi:hypothetical protein